MTSEAHVDIGVLEKTDDWRLHPRFFPSKVGGKPAWLDLKNLPSISDLSCKKCGDPLVLLCQVYAPFEESDNCFHRTLFLFICRNGSCCQTNSSENIVVLRSQLGRRNEYYSFNPYDEKKDEDFSIEQWCKLCNVCGLKGPSHCSKCKKVFYCSRKHQILDWQKEHKSLCDGMKDDPNTIQNNFIVTKAAQGLLFKEWELIVDQEDEEEATNVDENKEMEKLRKLMQEKKDGSLSNVTDNELEQYAQPVPEDKVFNKFSKRVARHPDQVLRYDRGGNPLWITGHTGNELLHVPKCEHCNDDRQFEFQIMPQLLNFIDVGIDFNSIDWGVLAVYTCKNSCNDGPAYKNEYIIKQDFSK